MLYLGSWAPISVLRSFSVLLIGFLQVLQFPSTSQNMPVGRLYDKKKPLVLSECLSMDAHGDLQWTDNPSSGSTHLDPDQDKAGLEKGNYQIKT